jgi:hypothetical protein
VDNVRWLHKFIKTLNINHIKAFLLFLSLLEGRALRQIALDDKLNWCDNFASKRDNSNSHQGEEPQDGAVFN